MLAVLNTLSQLMMIICVMDGDVKPLDISSTPTHTNSKRVGNVHVVPGVVGWPVCM